MVEAVRYQIVKPLTVKKVLTNHIPHFLINKKFLTVLGIIIAILFLYQFKSCFKKATNKIKDTVNITNTVKEIKDKAKNVTAKVKQPLIGAFKGALPKMDLEIPPRIDTTKVSIRGDDFDVYFPKDESIKVTIWREPIIKINPKLYGGAMIGYADSMVAWGVYAKFQPLEIKNFGFGAYAGTYNWKFSYGIAAGYIWKRVMFDILYSLNNKRLWGGVSLRI